MGGTDDPQGRRGAVPLFHIILHNVCSIACRPGASVAHSSGFRQDPKTAAARAVARFTKRSLCSVAWCVSASRRRTLLLWDNRHRPKRRRGPDRSETRCGSAARKESAAVAARHRSRFQPAGTRRDWHRAGSLWRRRVLELVETPHQRQPPSWKLVPALGMSCRAHARASPEQLLRPAAGRTAGRSTPEKFGDGLRPGAYLEFFVDPADVGVDGLVGDAEFLGDFLVEEALGQEIQDLVFPR